LSTTRRSIGSYQPRTSLLREGWKNAGTIPCRKIAFGEAAITLLKVPKARAP